MLLLLFGATEKQKNSESAFLLIFEPTQEKTQPDELCLASEGVNPGTEHNMKTKCGGWEIQVKVARLAKVKSLQLFQEHFYFCAIVHFFWHKKY